MLEDDTPALDTNMQSDLTTAGGATVDGEKNLAAILARTVGKKKMFCKVIIF